MALGKVHAIPGPDASTVSLLTKLLAEAKRGEIKGIAVAYVDNGNALNSDWTSGSADSSFMMAAITQLWFCVMKRKYEDD